MLPSLHSPRREATARNKAEGGSTRVYCVCDISKKKSLFQEENRHVEVEVEVWFEVGSFGLKFKLKFKLKLMTK
jgi:hypothetical protein